MSEPRRALVTGGASGFGLAIARRLLSEGAQVAVVDQSEAALEDAVAATDAALLGIRCDVRSREQVAAAADATVAAFGGLDTLIVSAGVIHIKPLADVTETRLGHSPWMSTSRAPSWRCRPPRHISSRAVGVASSPSRSDAGKRGFSWIAAYSASKFALIGLVESVAVELAPHQVTVNAVCPVGAPGTGMGRQVLDWKVRGDRTQSPMTCSPRRRRTNPLGRNATEADVVAAVSFLLSDGAAFLTGLSLDIDGGAHLGFLPGA